jgi:hypothetical protein
MNRADPGAGLTRAAITAITLTIPGLCFCFCFGNAHRLCAALGIEGWIAWLIGPSVDLSVIGLLLGVRYLASLGYSDEQLSKPRRLLNLCGLLTLALNTAEAVTRGQYGTAAVEAIGPILLICWADVGPWLLRQIHTHTAPDEAEPVQSAQDEHADEPSGAVQPPAPAEQLSAASRDENDLWAGALRLDTAHRAEHGRPITRDALREGLNIGTDRATELNRRLRSHTARTAGLATTGGTFLADPPQSEAAEPPALALAGTRS